MTHWLKKIFALITLAVLIAAFYPIQPTASIHLPFYQSSRVNIPKIDAIYDLGVPTGNTTAPRHLALDSQARRVYLLSEGIPLLKEGNGLSIYDAKSGEFVEQVTINQGDHEPLNLQIDPNSGSIYALWRERFSETPATLSVIDSQSLQTTQTIEGPEVMAVGDGHLYSTGSGELIRFSISGSKLIEEERLDLPEAPLGPMAVNPTANRLYLARAPDGAWVVEIYEAEAIELLASYPADGQILQIIPRSNDDVLVVTAENNFRLLHQITADGLQLDSPVELGPRYGAAGVALAPEEGLLYFSNGQPQPADQPLTNELEPALVGLDLSTLQQKQSIPLLNNLYDLIIDPESTLAFGLYPFTNHLYIIDLQTETVEVVDTAVELKDVFVDESSNRLFVSDTANRVRAFAADSLELLAETKLTGNGFVAGRGSGELALDPERQRLYVSGYPVAVLNSDSLIETTTIDPGGQVALDPAGDKLYVSHCGVTVLDADSLQGDTVLPGSGQRPDNLAPNPCVVYSQLDPVNQLLYSIVANGMPGSSGGSYLTVYDLAMEPTIVFTDTDISIIDAEPDSTNDRAYITYFNNSSRRLRTLDVEALPYSYTDQLMGIFGDARYNPTTNLLHISDRDFHRLLTVEADTLNVLGETLLPPNHNYRLRAVDTRNNRLYLTGLNGQLLIASPSGELGSELEFMSEVSTTRTADKSILTIEATEQETFARILSSYGQFSSDPRLYVSDNAGRGWLDLSQNLPGMAVRALAVSPDFHADQTVFAGLLNSGQTGGLYKSTDGGETWTAAMTGLRDVWVDGLFISPNFSQDQVIFARTTYAGLHLSTDGGETWTILSESNPNQLFPLANSGSSVAISNEGIILISQAADDQAADEIDGVYLTTLTDEDTLSEFVQVLDIPADHLAFSPDSSVALANGSGFWRSEDGGLTWDAGGVGLVGIDDLQLHRFMFSPDFATDQTVYAFFSDRSGVRPGILFRSTDAGESWQPWQEPQPKRNFTAVALTPDGDFLFGDDQAQLTRLDPSALSWQTSEKPDTLFPLDDLDPSPAYATDQTLFAVSKQQGLHKTTDGGQTWSLTSFPARTRDIGLGKYELAISPTYAEDETLYVATGRSLHRTTDGGESWEQVKLTDDPSTKNFSFQAQKVVFSPNFSRDDTLLVSTPAAVYRSTDGGDSWQPVLQHNGEPNAVDLLVVGPEGAVAYARFGYSQSLFASTDGGQTWQEQSTPDQYFFIVSGAVAPDGTLTAALEFETRLLQTQPQAEAWRMLDGPAGLSTLNAVTYGADDVLYAGGQGGLFLSMNKGQSWEPVDTAGLPGSATITGLYTTNENLFATLADGEIFVSGDDGATWDEISVVK